MHTTLIVRFCMTFDLTIWAKTLFITRRLKMAIQTIAPNGDVTDLSIPINEITLEKLQELVGGYIEVVIINAGFLMIVDEEGRFKSKQYNSSASVLCNRIIVGTAVILSGDEMKHFMS